MENILYRIEELYTTGWELIDEDSRGLTKEQCDAKLNYWLSQGVSPSNLRAILDT